MRAQRGFAGSYVIVRRAVAPLRLAASVASLTQRRFETGPGEQAQCDWGQITVPLNGVPTLSSDTYFDAFTRHPYLRTTG